MIKPAIVAVGYNRPVAMRRLLLSICNADYPINNITLVVSIDESDKSDEIQNVAEQIDWKYGEKIIRRFPKRQGLRNHVLQCGDLSEKYDAVIILEDDLMVSPSFYHYTYKAVNHYMDANYIAGISLYSHAWNGYANCHFAPQKSPYDAYLGKYSISWGQCWMKERWIDFRKWYKKIEDKLPPENDNMPANISHWNQHSWGKYFASYVTERDLYYVVPYSSMSTNFSEIGQHCTVVNTAHQVALMEGVKKNFEFPPYQDAVKYDMFFERILDDINISGISGNEICVDINGLKKHAFGKQYLLTTKKLPCNKVASFGMVMRPIDANVIHGIEGDEIYLYRCDKDISLPVNTYSYARREYETFDLSWKVLLKVGVRRLKESIKKHIKK